MRKIYPWLVEVEVVVGVEVVGVALLWMSGKLECTYLVVPLQELVR